MVLPLGDVEKTRIVPVATWVLIALNVAMYAVECDRGPTFQVAFAATPYEISHGYDIGAPVPLTIEPDEVDGLMPVRPGVREIEQGPVPFPVAFTILTAMFLHASTLHLVGNMLFLWIFGDNVEEVLGTFRYLLAYLGFGMAGTMAQVAAAPDSLIPTLGASGAIAGVMGAYIIWFPHNRVRVLFFNFLTEMPAYLVIGGWILLQIAGGYGSIGHLGEVGGVAYLAHIGGATAGLAVGLGLSPEGDPGPGRGLSGRLVPVRLKAISTGVQAPRRRLRPFRPARPARSADAPAPSRRYSTPGTTTARRSRRRSPGTGRSGPPSTTSGSPGSGT